MLNAAETKKLAAIKRAALANHYVSDENKQWVLNIVKREQSATPKAVLERAAAKGFDVTGIRVK